MGDETNTTPSVRSKAARAERLLYRLHNSGRCTSITRMQRIASIALRCGADGILTLNYANGNTNGR